MKNLFYILLLLISNKSYCQPPSACEIKDLDINYYEIVITRDNSYTSFFNIIGPEIESNNFVKSDLDNFIQNLLNHYYLSPIILFDRDYYFQDCIFNISEDENALFTADFDYNMEKYASKIEFLLGTGEKIIIKGCGIRGKFRKIQNSQIKFKTMSGYPNIINNIKIDEYMVVMKAQAFYSIKFD